MRQLHSITFTVTSSIAWRQACTKSHVTYRPYKVLVIEWWNTGKTGSHNKYKKCNFKKYWQDIVLRMLPFGSVKELGASCKSCSSDECTEASGGSSSSSSQSVRSFWRILMWSVSSSWRKVDISNYNRFISSQCFNKDIYYIQIVSFFLLANFWLLTCSVGFETKTLKQIWMHWFDFLPPLLFKCHGVLSLLYVSFRHQNSHLMIITVSPFLLSFSNASIT